MASRVYKAGTILSRTRCLLDAGVIKTRPLWLDVMEFLPPIRLPTHNSPPEPGTPPVIIFPNDSNINLEASNLSRNRNIPISLFETLTLAESRSSKKSSKGIEVGVPKETGEVGVPKETGEVGVPKLAWEVGVPKEAGEVGVPKEAGEVGIPKETGEVGVPKEVNNKGEGSELSTKPKKIVIKKTDVDPTDELLKFLDTLAEEQKMNKSN